MYGHASLWTTCTVCTFACGTQQTQTGGVGAATEVIERLILEPGEERPVSGG